MQTRFARMTDEQLLKQLKTLVQNERSLTAQVIEHLAECRRRDLHRKEGYPSLHQYCTEVLGLSEHAAYDRICAAKCLLQFPVVLEKLAQGAVNLTAIRLLAPHLTKSNHIKLLEAARGKTKLQVMEMIASLHPQPPVPASIRKLPQAGESARHESLRLETIPIPSAPSGSKTVDDTSPTSLVDAASPNPVDDASPNPVLPNRTRVSPLAPKLYKVEFTAGVETHQKLRQLQDLLRHQVPSGDLAVIIDMALSDLLEKVMKQRFGTAKPRRANKADANAELLELKDLVPYTNSFQNESEADTGHHRERDVGSANAVPGEHEAPPKTAVDVLRMNSNSRYIPKSVRKEVWERDRGQCAFLSHQGQRCSSRAWLEFHHVEPYAWGGAATSQNIELRCRAHNAYEGRLFFGSPGRVQRE